MDKYILSGANEYLVIINMKTQEIIKKLRPKDKIKNSHITALRISNNEQNIVAVGYEEGEVYVWDIEKEELILELNEHTSTINSICFSNDDQFIFTAAADTFIYVWDRLQNKYLFKYIYIYIYIYHILFILTYKFIIFLILSSIDWKAIKIKSLV